MIDLHCHILPQLDDGAADLATSLAMARQYIDDGVTTVACTPHILPGLYQNSGPGIHDAVRRLQRVLADERLELTLAPGADNHVVPDFVDGLRRGHLLPIANSRYVLVEPPHHILPVRLEDLFFSIKLAGYVPILTHPERLSWIRDNYALILRLVDHGVWLQVTAGSLAGRFGREAVYWAERLLGDGAVHVLATDAHDTRKRPPELGRGRELAARLVGDCEAFNLVSTRPAAVLRNCEPNTVPPPARGRAGYANVRAEDPGATARLHSGSRIVRGLQRLLAR